MTSKDRVCGVYMKDKYVYIQYDTFGVYRCEVRGTSNLKQDIFRGEADIGAACDALRYLRENIENDTGILVTSCVAAVPPFFQDKQRMAVKELMEKAGFKILRVINEPTACCLGHSLEMLADDPRIEYNFLYFNFSDSGSYVCWGIMEEGIYEICWAEKLRDASLEGFEKYLSLYLQDNMKVVKDQAVLIARKLVENWAGGSLKWALKEEICLEDGQVFGLSRHKLKELEEEFFDLEEQEVLRKIEKGQERLVLDNIKFIIIADHSMHSRVSVERIKRNFEGKIIMQDFSEDKPLTVHGAYVQSVVLSSSFRIHNSIHYDMYSEYSYDKIYVIHSNGYHSRLYFEYESSRQSYQGMLCFVPGDLIQIKYFIENQAVVTIELPENRSKVLSFSLKFDEGFQKVSITIKDIIRDDNIIYQSISEPVLEKERPKFEATDLKKEELEDQILQLIRNINKKQGESLLTSLIDLLTQIRSLQNWTSEDISRIKASFIGITTSGSYPIKTISLPLL